MKTYIQSGNVVFQTERTDLAAKVERALGVAATARNWRTVSKVVEMGTAVSTK